MTDAAPPLRDPTRLTRWLEGLLILSLAVHVVSILSSFAQYSLLELAGQAPVSQFLALATSYDRRQQAVAFVYLVVALVVVVLFCCWIYRANCNARALGAQGMSFTPGWSVGWFFIPIASRMEAVPGDAGNLESQRRSDRLAKPADRSAAGLVVRPEFCSVSERRPSGSPSASPRGLNPWRASNRRRSPTLFPTPRISSPPVLALMLVERLYRIQRSARRSPGNCFAPLAMTVLIMLPAPRRGRESDRRRFRGRSTGARRRARRRRRGAARR